MVEETLLRSPGAFRAQFERLIDELRASAPCGQWSVSAESFAEGLRRSAAKRFGSQNPSQREIEAYLRSLHIEDLALACACSEGTAEAWEFFVAHYREQLHVAARAILRESGHGDEARSVELADSLFAELYGLRTGKGGQRNSLFDYFHGRSKLSTWLGAILAQRQVDLVRASARIVPLESQEQELANSKHGPGRPDPPRADHHREGLLARLDRALSAALTELVPRERMILSCYYVDQLNLAEIGRMLRTHESTVSRQLERIRQTLREHVARALKSEMPARNGLPAESALDDAQVDLAFEYALEDWGFDLPRVLAKAGTREDAPGK